MPGRPARTSPRAASCRPHLGRRAVAVLLLLACIPSLALNAGAGRNLLIHDHGHGEVHAHALNSAAAAQHRAGWHDADHGDEFWALGHDGFAAAGEHLATASPAGEDLDGAVLRGSAAAAVRRDGPAPSADPCDLGFPPVPACRAALPALAPARAWPAPAVGPRAVDLAALRAVVLLI